MKFNKWTLGLAAIGVVSLASAAKADEKTTAIQAALSSTTISGYVDTSAQWNLGTGNASLPPYSFGGSSKADGFNLNVVQLTIAKPLDEAEWASGYRVDLWFGPDANTLNTGSINSTAYGDFAIRQAYVALRTPVGNGIDWKFGVFDTVLGYESLESGNNPNYTHSYGFTIEPTTHTGVLATYRINDMISVSGGVANTIGPTINERAHGPHPQVGPNSSYKAESYKTYMASVALTAPSDWGWAAGSTLYGGVVNGFNSAVGDNQTSVYAGTTVATPVAGLKVGAAFDWLCANNYLAFQDEVWTAGLYASYQATEKMSIHGRGEYLSGELAGPDLQLYALTATLQYDLWQNVISRLEFRWDYCGNGPIPNGKLFGGSTVGSSGGPGNSSFATVLGESLPPEPVDERSAIGEVMGFSSSSVPTSNGQRNAYMLALQLIYKF